MRIVFVMPALNTSGGVRTVVTYARLLARRGHAVTIVSVPHLAPSWRSRIKALLHGTPIPRPGHAFLEGLEVEHRRLERSRPIVEGDVPDADVVIATWWLTAEWVAALSPRKGAKVHFIQGNEQDIPGQPEARVAATWRLPFHRIVCSRWLAGLAATRYGAEGVSCVPNGVDLSAFRAPPRERQPRPTVGFVYSQAPIKGCDVAAAAVKLLRVRLPQLRVVAFGGAPPTTEFPLPPDTEFSLLPDEPRIPQIYASADAWLWPSRQEGFGLPILEAMACRTPVIAAPAGAAPDLLARGGGILLPAAEPGPMAEAIERVLGLGPAAWRSLSDEARSVAERHGWDQSVVSFESALQHARQCAPPVQRVEGQ